MNNDFDGNGTITTDRPQLYALLVGIDAYKENVVLEDHVIFSKLSGCARDSQKIKEYLQLNKAAFDLHIEHLQNKKATKQAIVHSFMNHLSQAGKDDVILFYYSGHGTQEDADPEAWTSEIDDRLECLACYYKTREDDFLLSDKELRYLIHRLSAKEPHIVTVFDCCHSADNTRNGMMVKTVFDRTAEKRIPYSFPQRSWDKFIFSKNISRDDVVQKGEAVALPEGLHISITACESDESAVEVNGEGVFTKNLLKVLAATGGEVSYYSLRSRVRQYLRSIYEQKPRFYVSDGNDARLYSIFLNKPYRGSKTAFGEVTYNENMGWLLNMGAIHGIGEKTKTITLIDPADDTKSCPAAMVEIKTDYTQLHPEASLETEKVYKAYVEGLLSRLLQINVQNTDSPPEDQHVLMNQLTDELKDCISPEDVESKAQYVVRSDNGRYYITLPHNPYRPLVTLVKATDENAVLSIADDLRHISKWEFLKNLSNQDLKNNLPHNALQVDISRLVQDGSHAPVMLDNNDPVIEYEVVNNEWKSFTRINLTNTTAVTLYCCVVYLDSDFSAFTDFLKPSVKPIPPGKSVILTRHEANQFISASLDPVTRLYNWKEQGGHLKLIISTEEFDAQSLSLEGLPKPLPTFNRVMRSKGIDKILLSPDEDDISGWTTKTINLHFLNPEYNKISRQRLDAMLRNPDLADFALGIYFDAVTGEDLAPDLVLKPQIEMAHKEGTEKDLMHDTLVDLANLRARTRRNQHYRIAKQRFPKRVAIVSEGDSWFQHPLVTNIIDHLSRVYDIYCVATTGDTLRNYFSREKANGEFYLDALEKENPSFFLISGGGNDLLGSKFRSHLKEYSSTGELEGSDPVRFLKPSFFDEIDDLMDIYKTAFIQLQTHHPEIRVIVHGYDYPVKLNDAKKGWLGRYMIEKGIAGEGDRRAIIRLIMDKFNTGLQQVARDFNNVTYIDLRNIVKYDPANNQDQWYDEIHPDNNGFQQIAMRFMQTINEVCVRKKLIASGKP